MKIFIGIFGAVGVILMAIAGLLFYKTESFESKGILTQGTVVKMLPSRGGTGTHHGGYTYAPVVTFIANDNKEHTCRSNIYSSPPSYSVGDKADVYYNPANPDDAVLGGASAFLATYILGGIGLLFSGIAAMFYFIIVKNTGTKELMETGRKIQADFISVDVNTSIAINGRNPYIIHSQWMDSLENKVYSFKSKSIWFDPKPFLANRNKIDVYIDQNNPKKYFMDIFFLPKEG
jgi:hypothetical protein